MRACVCVNAYPYKPPTVPSSTRGRRTRRVPLEYPIEYPMRTLEFSAGCPLRRTPSIHRVSTSGTRERIARPRVRREYPIGRVYCSTRCCNLRQPWDALSARLARAERVALLARREEHDGREACGPHAEQPACTGTLRVLTGTLEYRASTLSTHGVLHYRLAAHTPSSPPAPVLLEYVLGPHCALPLLVSTPQSSLVHPNHSQNARRVSQNALDPFGTQYPEYPRCRWKSPC